MSSAKSRKKGLPLIVERFIYTAPLAILTGFALSHFSRTLSPETYYYVRIGAIGIWLLYIAVDFFLRPWFIRTFPVKKK